MCPLIVMHVHCYLLYAAASKKQQVVVVSPLVSPTSFIVHIGLFIEHKSIFCLQSERLAQLSAATLISSSKTF